ncbi:uncharacterized protein LOC133191451 [Saccostrea echinata]|uniref:uncharacterized protein LOC133191451 n=1 Tax=Saccostrea echinata TaxID=191078 RepID=UPI002A7FC812|nr:uncharacterized protein LOC133191451 [Saccostrea echinata]
MDRPVQRTPLKSIGAQDILKLDFDKCGHLRKEGGLERTLLSKFVKWRQFFVVLRNGCCYVFDNDQSTQSKTAFSFENYCRLECYTRPDMDNCFKVIPRPGHEDLLKEHCFSSSDNHTRQEWLVAIYRALHVANNLTVPTAITKDGWKEDIFAKGTDPNRYSYIDEMPEDPPKDPPKPAGKRYSKLPSPPVPSLTRAKSLPARNVSQRSNSNDTSNDSDDSPSDNYDDILTEPPPTKPEPLTAKPCKISRSVSESYKSRPQPPVPVDERGTVSLPDSYTNLKEGVADLPLFEGNASDAKSVIKDEAVGTFLIRKSSTGGDKIMFVLVFSAPSGELQYRIYKKEEEKIYLTEGVYFKRLSELVDYYRKNDLPCKRKLTKHYGHMDL